MRGSQRGTNDARIATIPPETPHFEVHQWYFSFSAIACEPAHTSGLRFQSGVDSGLGRGYSMTGVEDDQVIRAGCAVVAVRATPNGSGEGPLPQSRAELTVFNGLKLAVMGW